MSSRTEAAFRSLHDTLVHVNLLSRLTDENVTLPAAESQDLSDLLRDLTSKAISQAIAAEQEVAGITGDCVTRDVDIMGYAVAKQLSAAHSIESRYGTIRLDQELATAVEAAVRPIFERRLKQAGNGGVSHG